MTGLNFDMATIKNCIVESTNNSNAIIDIDKMVKDIYDLHEIAKIYPRSNASDITTSMYKLYFQTKKLADKHLRYNEEEDVTLMLASIFMIVTEGFATSIPYGHEEISSSAFLSEMFMFGRHIFDPSIKDSDAYVLCAISQYLSRRFRTAA